MNDEKRMEQDALPAQRAARLVEMPAGPNGGDLWCGSVEGSYNFDDFYMFLSCFYIFTGFFNDVLK